MPPFSLTPFSRRLGGCLRPALLIVALLLPGNVSFAQPGQQGQTEAETGRKNSTSRTVVYRGARILTASGKTYARGILIVRDGKIVAVGDPRDVAVPPGADVRDLTGKVIIPGLVDSHSHLGVYSRPMIPANADGGESSGPIQGIVRALDSLNPFDPGIRMANAGGVTTANIMPGSGNVIGGQTIYVKLRGYTPERMWIASPDVLGGLKMANGENPKRGYGRKGQAPGTRMKITALQRSEFIKARQYLKKKVEHREKIARGEKSDAPDIDLALQPLAEVLEKKRTVHFHTHRADDILTVLRLKREFGFDLVIQHGTEAYKVLDEVAAAKVSVSMTILDSPGGKAEVVDFLEETGAEMDRKGIPVIINTDDPITESRFLLRTAATAVRGGLSTDVALRSLTINPARAMHLDSRLGSLEPGKDADFVVLSGDPFSVYTRVLQTYIDGAKIFDLDNNRRFQTGGFALDDKSLLPKGSPPVAPLVPGKMSPPPVNAIKVDDDSREFVVLARRLHTVSRGTIVDGAVHVREGKILFAGPRDNFQIPPRVAVITASDVTPGLIDAHSVVPLDGQLNIPADSDADEMSDPNQADVRTLDGFNPSEPLLRVLLEQGVTVVHACPGGANVIAGSSGVFRTHGKNAEKMAIRFPQALVFNLGERPKSAYSGKRPSSRMGTASLIRQALSEARTYAKKRAAIAADKTKDAKKSPPDRDLKHETLALALDKKVPVLFAANRADDILTALRLIREFQLEGIVASATEGYLIRDQLALAKTPVLVHPTMQRSGDMETFHSYLGNAAALADAGVPLAITSGIESYVPKTRIVRYEAAMAMVYGLGFQRALRSITLDAAKILRIDDQYGSLDVGKKADLVLYDGDPFEHATHVTSVFVDGRRVHQRGSRPRVPFTAQWYQSILEIPCCLGY